MSLTSALCLAYDMSVYLSERWGGGGGKRLLKTNPITLVCMPIWFVYGVRNVGIVTNVFMFSTNVFPFELNPRLQWKWSYLKHLNSFPWSVILFCWIIIFFEIQIANQHLIPVCEVACPILLAHAGTLVDSAWHGMGHSRVQNPNFREFLSVKYPHRLMALKHLPLFSHQNFFFALPL
jgi:hypothetical protein